MPTFNLIDEPWIPCLFDDGSARDASLFETLAGADHIREVYDPLPLVTVALHRLLLAVLHRVVDGPHTRDAWAALWARGTWDAAAVRAYLERWRDRFDLFGQRFPFYQTPEIGPEYAGSAAKLAQQYASGNNATLFDHTSDRSGLTLTPAEAARAVVGLQAFSVGGLVSHLPGEDKQGHKSAKGSPPVKGAVALVKGETLFETLALNLHQYDCAHGIPSPCMGEDRPAWERDAPTRPGERWPDGYLDLLTWQSRRVRLVPEEPDGQTIVARAAVMKGYQLPDDYELRGRETMLAFKANPAAKPAEQAYRVLGFSEDRALWRDSLALLEAANPRSVRPKVLDWVHDLLASGKLARAPDALLPLDLYGMATDQAKVLLWRHERIPVPPALLESKDARDQLRSGLDLAEGVGGLFIPGFYEVPKGGKKERVPRPFRRLADVLLSARPGEGQGSRAYGERVTALVEHLGPRPAYWARLAAPFARFIHQLGAEIERGGSSEDALLGWARAVRTAAREAFEEAVSGLDGSGRGFQAIASAQSAFNARLNRLLAKYPLEEEEVVA
jgi:CRISPR system Cascade subunit CasA